MHGRIQVCAGWVRSVSRFVGGFLELVCVGLGEEDVGG